MRRYQVYWIAEYASIGGSSEWHTVRYRRHQGHDLFAAAQTLQATPNTCLLEITMRMFVLMVLAATLEVGGDALIRSGLKSGGGLLMALGAVVLVGYGFMVNLTSLDFSRLMGLYIVIFFVVAQLTAMLFFGEKPPLPVLVGGVFVMGGGLTMACWQAP
jgi:drug/metabolite transporter superfamily protein YnfA